MTYRVGAHSTSDDDSKYREPSAPEEGWDDERSYWEVLPRYTRDTAEIQLRAQDGPEAASAAFVCRPNLGYLGYQSNNLGETSANPRSCGEARSPIVRFGRYLHQRGCSSGSDEDGEAGLSEGWHGGGRRGCFSGADEERMRRALLSDEEIKCCVKSAYSPSGHIQRRSLLCPRG